MANIAWDAGKYAKSFSYVAGYGEALLGLLEARPGMTCLDLGCGNGALTQKLKDAGLDAFGIVLALVGEQICGGEGAYRGPCQKSEE